MKTSIHIVMTSLMVLLVMVHICPLTFASDARDIRLNCADRYWYPFLYTQSDQVKGIFHDMVSKAMENLNIKLSVQPVPVRRAMVNARKGMVHGVIAVGYRPDLISILDFPPHADVDKESPWRMLQVDHVVVSFAEQDYDFEGVLNSLPEPVRLLQDDPIIGYLNNAGIIPQEVREDEQNFLKLIRDKSGVIITTSVTAEMMNRDPRFQGKIKIHGMPVASHSYYLVFSKKSGVKYDDRLKIWREIKRLRDDYIFMLQVFSQY